MLRDRRQYDSAALNERGAHQDEIAPSTFSRREQHAAISSVQPSPTSWDGEQVAHQKKRPAVTRRRASPFRHAVWGLACADDLSRAPFHLVATLSEMNGKIR